MKKSRRKNTKKTRKKRKNVLCPEEQAQLENFETVMESGITEEHIKKIDKEGMKREPE